MTPAPVKPHGRRAVAWRVAGIAAGIALLVWAMRDVDPASLGASLVAVGPAVPLVLVPYGIGLVLHAEAWQILLAVRGTRVPLPSLVRAFMAAEAARMTLPAGEAVGESLATWSLATRFGVSWGRAIAAVAAKKAWVFATNGLWLLVALTAGRDALGRLAASLGPSGVWLPRATWLMAAILVAAGASMLALLQSPRARAIAASLSKRLPERFRVPPATAAQQAEPATTSLRAHAAAAFLLFAQWATEVFEAWLILDLLGVHLGAGEVIVLELGGALIRSLAFFVPGGVGVQDASYIAVLAALGVPSATTAGAAFLVIKRSKEIVYVALGLLALPRGARAGGGAPTESSR